MSNRYSYSQLSTYAACPTRFKFRYVDQLSPLAEPDHDLRFGRAWDAALNCIYMGGDVADAQHDFSQSYPEDEYPPQLPFWSPGKSFAGGLAAIPQYVEKWLEDDRNWEVVSVQSREHKDGDDESRTVVLDLVIRDRRDGLIYGVDNKSTGKYLDANYASQFDPHSQIRQYVDFLQSKYGECGGFYINAASFRHRTKAYTPRKGSDKGVQLPAGDWCDFKRYLFTPNQQAVKQEQQSFSNWVRKIELDREQGSWAYNTDQCVRGPIVCPYHEICSAGYTWPEDAELITQHYQLRCLRLVDGQRCWLAPNHEGECDPTKPVQPDYEVDLNEEIEEAMQ